MYDIFKRLFIIAAIVIVVAGSVAPGHTGAILPTDVRNALVEAAGKGEDALLEAVDAAVRADPEIAQAIVDEASKLNPELEQAIFTVAPKACVAQA